MSNAYRPEFLPDYADYWFPENLCLLSDLGPDRWIGNVRLDRKLFTLWRLNGPAHPRDCLSLRRSLEGPPTEALALAEPILGLRVWPAYAAYGESPGGVMLLPALHGVLSGAEPLVVPAAAAELLASIDAGVTVGDQLPRLAAGWPCGRAEITYLIWAAKELYLLGSDGESHLNCWEQRQAAMAIASRMGVDDLGVSRLCSRLIDPPDWLRRLRWQAHPAEALLALVQWSLSQGIVPAIQTGGDGSALHVPLREGWIEELQRLMP